MERKIEKINNESKEKLVKALVNDSVFVEEEFLGYSITSDILKSGIAGVEKAIREVLMQMPSEEIIQWQNRYHIYTNMVFFPDTKEAKEQFHQRLQFFSNCLGELHYHGERDITEEELPKPLQRAYRDLWTEAPGGSRCYLCEYCGAYGIVLENEYVKDDAEYLHCNPDDLLEAVKLKAEKMAECLDEMVLVAENDLEKGVHTIYVFLYSDTSVAHFNDVCDFLERYAYDEDTPFCFPVKKKRSKETVYNSVMGGGLHFNDKNGRMEMVLPNGCITLPDGYKCFLELLRDAESEKTSFQIHLKNPDGNTETAFTHVCGE